MAKNKVFWLDGFNGEAVGGFFIRNTLKDFVETLEEKGLNPVGIKYDGTLNLELIVEKNKVYVEKYENMDKKIPTKLNKEIIDSYGFKSHTYKPDHDDVAVEYTLPNDLVLTALTVCFNEPTECDSLYAYDDKIYITTKEELDEVIAMNFNSVMKKYNITDF